MAALDQLLMALRNVNIGGTAISLPAGAIKPQTVNFASGITGTYNATTQAYDLVVSGIPAVVRVAASGTLSSSISTIVLTNTLVSAITITMPPSPTDGAVMSFKDSQGTWASHNLTVAANSSVSTQQIESPTALATYASTQVLNTNGGHTEWVFDAVQGIWFII